MSYLLQNAHIINEGRNYYADILLKDGIIEKIEECGKILPENNKIIDLEGKYVLPGLIDCHVHFRDPGLSYKGDIASESMAAVAGGVTSYFDMPNTKPAAITNKILDEKYNLAKNKSFANYAFYLGATNNNIEELDKADYSKIPGIKVFLGASTGDLLVDDDQALEDIFFKIPKLIAVHSEDQKIIEANTYQIKETHKNINPNEVPFNVHPIIRSEEACYNSSLKAVELAKKHETRLHLLHISTAKELELLSNHTPVDKKLITAEVCIPHLWFTEEDFKIKKGLIKCNPSVKTKVDREKLRKALKNGIIDVVATDHAPHTIEEKNHPYFMCPSGMPSIQHMLLVLLELADKGYFDITDIPKFTSHNVAKGFHLKNRGFIKEGYCGDLVVIDKIKKNQNNKESQDQPSFTSYYKCGWHPFEGYDFSWKVLHTFVNSKLVYSNDKIVAEPNGEALIFEKL
ncbi:MAG: dihydroorotase [Bacteroidales bacterium]|jgi:dihydroorotase